MPSIVYLTLQIPAAFEGAAAGRKDNESNEVEVGGRAERERESAVPVLLFSFELLLLHLPFSLFKVTERVLIEF